MTAEGASPRGLRVKQYLLTGFFVVLPLWVTWLVLKFVFQLIASAGQPLVRALARAVVGEEPGWADWLLNPWVQGGLATLLVLAGLYLLGWAATRVVGSQIISFLNRLVERIPFVKSIYGSTRKLLAALQQKPERVQRVVLIDFPSPEMKTVGLVTRTFTDAATGEELAAVYVPTTPNPTSGYLEIVPLARVISTDWTLDDAMSFIVSGGAVGPEKIHYSAPPPRSG